MNLKLRLGVLAALLMGANLAQADGKIYLSASGGTFDHDQTNVMLRSRVDTAAGFAPRLNARRVISRCVHGPGHQLAKHARTDCTRRGVRIDPSSTARLQPDEPTSRCPAQAPFASSSTYRARLFMRFRSHAQGDEPTQSFHAQPGRAHCRQRHAQRGGPEVIPHAGCGEQAFAGSRSAATGPVVQATRKRRHADRCGTCRRCPGSPAAFRL